MPYKPGESGNPSGRTKKFVKKYNKFAGRCRTLSPRALKVLEEQLESDDEKLRFLAAKEILDRAWGRPMQAVMLADETTAVPQATLDRPPELTRQQWLEHYTHKQNAIDVTPEQ